MRLFACLIVAPQWGYDEPAILSYAISSFCPTSADGLHRACDPNDVRIGGLPLLYADVHARRLDPVDLHGHNSSPVADVHQRRGCGYDPGYCNRAKLPTLGIPKASPLMRLRFVR